MENHSLVKGSRWVLEAASKIRSIPFEWNWDAVTQVTIMEGSKLKFYAMSALVSCSHTLFQIVQLMVFWDYYMAQVTLPPELFLNLVWLAAFSWIFSSHIHMLLYRDQIKSLQNRICVFSRQIQGVCQIRLNLFVKNR